MKQHELTVQKIIAFGHWLIREERSAGTVEKYLRDVRALYHWLNGGIITRETLTGWKDYLCTSGYSPITVNSMLGAVHSFLVFAGLPECRVKYLRIQRRLFRDESRELNRAEYTLLLETAKKRGQERLSLLMETICSTGIRVSEVQYITVESVQKGCTEVSLKGKIRTILLSDKLRRKLLRYVQKNKIVSGTIFHTRSGKNISRRQIWGEMKQLCKHAGVESSKVFPHNLRHLFAVTFYKLCKDIVQLADVLGHSSVETTRIYLISTGREHVRQLERLGLIT